MLESNYKIRSARAEELPLLAQIERSAAILFLNTPYAFLANDEPLSLDFVQQRFQVGQDQNEIESCFLIKRIQF
jgi:hypothetical protein